MLRLAILEWRLASSQHLVLLLLVVAANTFLAWAQEPWFLRSSGLHILWHGSAATSVICFLAGGLFWLHQVQERRTWNRMLDRDPRWPLASGCALAVYGIIVVSAGFAISKVLDAASGDPTPIRELLGASLPWFALVLPIAFLLPGLAFVPAPMSLRTALAAASVAASACLLDPAAVPGNLVGPLLASLGSALLSASLQRASTNWTLHAARHPR